MFIIFVDKIVHFHSRKKIRQSNWDDKKLFIFTHTFPTQTGSVHIFIDIDIRQSTHNFYIVFPPLLSPKAFDTFSYKTKRKTLEHQETIKIKLNFMKVFPNKKEENKGGRDRELHYWIDIVDESDEFFNSWAVRWLSLFPLIVEFERQFLFKKLFNFWF